MIGVPLDDRRARALGIPAFGIAIPFLTGLYGPLGVDDGVAWAGAAWFLALSAAIWHGNRWLLFRGRTSLDWLQRPLRRVVLLVAGIVLYTAPLTVGAMLAWRWFSGVDVDAGQIRAVTLMNVICVVFVAHVYETVLLIKDRESDLVRVERIERARAEAELLALRRQVDPHFIFNCLNTLQHLIDEDPPRAKVFNQDFAAVARYLLTTSDRHSVKLRDELAFVRRYAALLAIRFGPEAFRVDIRDDGADLDTELPPTALQLLVENAAKHNAFTAKSPLVVSVQLQPDRVVVSNARAAKERVAGAGRGLANLAARVRLGSGRALDIEDTHDTFRVTVPVSSPSSAQMVAS